MVPKTRIMYIEFKGNNGIVGDARIGRVSILNKGKTLIYGKQRFQSLRGRGFKSNYYDVETQDYYWISGCRKDGRDALYNNRVEIDEDVMEEYWTEIRRRQANKHVNGIRALRKNK